MSTAELEAENRLYTIRETAQLTTLSESSIRRFIKSGQVKSVKIGSRYMIPGWFLYDLVSRPTAEVSP